VNKTRSLVTAAFATAAVFVAASCAGDPYEHLPPDEKARCEKVKESCDMGFYWSYTQGYRKSVQEYECRKKRGCETVYPY
jgi:hypothetical protein